MQTTQVSNTAARLSLLRSVTMDDGTKQQHMLLNKFYFFTFSHLRRDVFLNYKPATARDARWSNITVETRKNMLESRALSNRCKNQFLFTLYWPFPFKCVKLVRTCAWATSAELYKIADKCFCQKTSGTCAESGWWAKHRFVLSEMFCLSEPNSWALRSLKVFKPLTSALLREEKK